jgi:hypothetical protein
MGSRRTPSTTGGRSMAGWRRARLCGSSSSRRKPEAQADGCGALAPQGGAPGGPAKNNLKPAVRRQLVTETAQLHAVGVRRVCRGLGFPRSSHCCVAGRDPATGPPDPATGSRDESAALRLPPTLRSLATRGLGSQPRRQRHSRVKQSTAVKRRKRAPVASWSETKSIAQC